MLERSNRLGQAMNRKVYLLESLNPDERADVLECHRSDSTAIVDDALRAFREAAVQLGTSIDRDTTEIAVRILSIIPHDQRPPYGLGRWLLTEALLIQRWAQLERSAGRSVAFKGNALDPLEKNLPDWPSDW
jgi:hypothetical protein